MTHLIRVDKKYNADKGLNVLFVISRWKVFSVKSLLAKEVACVRDVSMK